MALNLWKPLVALPSSPSSASNASPISRLLRNARNKPKHPLWLRLAPPLSLARLFRFPFLSFPFLLPFSSPVPFLIIFLSSSSSPSSSYSPSPSSCLPLPLLFSRPIFLLVLFHLPFPLSLTLLPNRSHFSCPFHLSFCFPLYFSFPVPITSFP